ncbi:MAG: cytochrome c [Polyangiales bacterium]
MSLALSACSESGPSLAAEYRDIDVPEEVLASRDARARGHVLFLEKCALCHGVRANGRGVRRQGLSGPPVDFQSAQWRSRATPRGVYAVLSEGVRGTSMPAWPTLSGAQKWDVVSYVLSVAEERP